MKSIPIKPVILCGGSGTRLWPLSRKSFPKQFVPLLDGRNLLDMTIERLAGLSSPPVIVAAEDHRFLVADALASPDLAGEIILEPEGRNTAAAMAMTALLAVEQQWPLLLFCPADHHVPDADAFLRTVRRGGEAACAGAIVTFGVSPTGPSTAYGYIRRGAPRDDGCFRVATFVEKPDAVTAGNMLLSGEYLWNAGIFLCRPDILICALERHAPDILDVCRRAFSAMSRDRSPGGLMFLRPEPEAFCACRSESIDYAVLEHFAEIAVVPFSGQWSDVGSWTAVADLVPADDNGNRVQGKGILHHSENTYIYAPDRTVVALGTSDLLIVDTPDALLVARRDHAEQVKQVVSLLFERNLPEAVTHRKVARPWGWYDSLALGSRFQVKRISVKPGAALSLQRHHHRAEHWVVVRGTAEVSRGDDSFLLTENQSAYIPVGELHRLRNPGKIALEIIEIQSGSYLGEDDIERLDDIYLRKS